MAKSKNTVSKVAGVMDGPWIDFAKIEKDVDEDGCVDPLHGNEGIETRYARLVGSRTTALFCGLVGDYEDCHIEIRVPLHVLEQLVAEMKESK